jgi:hypothetical protein
MPRDGRASNGGGRMSGEGMRRSVSDIRSGMGNSVSGEVGGSAGRSSSEKQRDGTATPIKRSGWGKSTALPKDWSCDQLLRKESALLETMRVVAKTGGFREFASSVEERGPLLIPCLATDIEIVLEPQNMLSLKLASLSTSHDSLRPGPPAGIAAGLSPLAYVDVFKRWHDWCRLEGICTIPIVGAVVTCYLARAPVETRQKTVFILELYRQHTSKNFVGINREQLRLNWQEKEWQTFDAVVEQAQWPLPEWKAIAELAPPAVLAKQTQ